MIKGLFYSEFDNVAGPVILFQAPDKCVARLVAVTKGVAVTLTRFVALVC
jgi:hypothetical protein